MMYKASSDGFGIGSMYVRIRCVTLHVQLAFFAAHGTT
jgi:hypothetical protein